MRLVREVTAEEENFRIEGSIIRRDPVMPESVGTLVLLAFRIVSYRQDCDGSLMASLAHVAMDIQEIANEGEDIWLERLGLYPHTGLVVSCAELQQMIEENE